MTCPYEARIITKDPLDIDGKSRMIVNESESLSVSLNTSAANNRLGSDVVTLQNDRYDTGELFSEDSIHFADSLKYTTPKGKTVYGGGGIMPDIYVPLVNDSTEYYFNRIANTGLLYQYAFEYTDRHRQEFNNKYKTPESFAKSFQVSDAMFNELVKLADEKGVKGTDEQKVVARREANILLKAYIARNLFDDEGFYPIYAQMDEVLQRALKELRKE